MPISTATAAWTRAISRSSWPPGRSDSTALSPRPRRGGTHHHAHTGVGRVSGPRMGRRRPASAGVASGGTGLVVRDDVRDDDRLESYP
jgi:hypothetical protein